MFHFSMVPRSTEEHQKGMVINMGSISSKKSISFVLIACITLCLVCLSGCKRLPEESSALQTAAETTKTSDEAAADACSNAVQKLIQKPYYHVVLTSNKDSIQTQIYRDGENYLVSDYDGELQLASAIKYDGVYAFKEAGKYSIMTEDQTAHVDSLIQSYDILENSNVEILNVEHVSDDVIRIHAQWDEDDNGTVAHIQGNYTYEFGDNRDLSSVLVVKNGQIGEESAASVSYSLVNLQESQQAIAAEIEKAAQQIADPGETDSGYDVTLIAPPSNLTEFDRNYPLGSEEMKWDFFEDPWTFSLGGENPMPGGITMVHKPASETAGVVLNHGGEYFLESWDGNQWNLLYRGTVSSEAPEETAVFSGNTITEPVPVSVNWGDEYGALEAGKYRVGMYYTAIRSSAEQETNLCYAKFVINSSEKDSLIQKCNSALEEILGSNTYHIQRTDYMSQKRDDEGSYYYVTNVWKSGQNFYEEVTYYYNSTDEIRSALGMLLRDGKGYSWNTLQSLDKSWSENDDLTQRSFQLWPFGLECAAETLENITKQEDTIICEFPYTSVTGKPGNIQGKIITYYFSQNDKLVRVTLEYLCDNQEKMMETELLVNGSSSESSENIILNQDITALLSK